MLRVLNSDQQQHIFWKLVDDSVCACLNPQTSGPSQHLLSHHLLFRHLRGNFIGDLRHLDCYPSSFSKTYAIIRRIAPFILKPPKIFLSIAIKTQRRTRLISSKTFAMDQSQPHRATAAQLAARSIKSKPKPRRAGPSRPGPFGGSVPSQNQSGHGQMPQQGAQPVAGGLFGGGIQASGSFEFASPAGGISTPSFGSAFPSQGGNNVNGQSTNESHNEGRFEGDNRATKRPFGGLSTIPQSNSPFQPSSLFGQGQPSNLFSTTNAAPQAGGIFAFGSAPPPQQQQPGASIFNFNQTVASPSQPPSNTFSFTPSQPTPSIPSINFGAGTSREKPGNNMFSFNQQPPQTATQATSSFNFGTSATQEKPGNSPFLFGQKSQPQTSGVSFSSTPTVTAASSNLFGAVQSQQSTTNMFGSTNQQAPSSSGIFANLNTSKALGTKMFSGSREQSPAPTTSNLLGGQAQTPKVNNIFSSLTSAPTTSNIFGDKIPASSSTNLSANATSPIINPFNKEKREQPARSTSLFSEGGEIVESSKDIVGNLIKPVGPAAPQPETTGLDSGNSQSIASTEPNSFNRNVPYSKFSEASKTAVRYSLFPQCMRIEFYAISPLQI